MREPRPKCQSCGEPCNVTFCDKCDATASMTRGIHCYDETLAAQREIDRQNELFGTSNDVDHGGVHVAYCTLAEEVGEVARAINKGKPDELRTELVQVAALALRMACNVRIGRYGKRKG